MTINATRLDDNGPNFSTQTSSTGQYLFDGIPESSPPATYKVTASKGGFTFSPTQTTLEMDGDKEYVNFTGMPLSYAISGRVTNSQGAGISQVTVTLSGSDGNGR
ncbi:MAG: carboxypeptidase-like regulatory domain-containing protein [Blastocatellales bacterium]